MEKGMIDFTKYYNQIPQLASIKRCEPCCWLNPNRKPYAEQALPLPAGAIADAEQRLKRFAPFIQERFPETAEMEGLIESPLQEIPRMQARLNSEYDNPFPGRLLLKMDSHLPISGSVKARGGIYEILKFAESLALTHGVLHAGDDYRSLACPAARELFGRYHIQAGSTGNLGLSIGIISAALGFRVSIHMSADAKQWKKDLLRRKGACVMEYAGDYTQAVARGRAAAELEQNSYFVDDEHSTDLFLGYAVAANRLKVQLDAMGIVVNRQNPLFVYLPCGIGGAPGGITFGLKTVFHDDVHCFFTEPTHSCCMLLGMATGLHDRVSVQDFGIDGVTQADGLAVGRPSAFIGKAVEGLLGGICTAGDDHMFMWLRELLETEGIFIEPSACAAFAPALFTKELRGYTERLGLQDNMHHCTHIAWATGGGMVPFEIVESYRASAQNL